MSKKSPRNNTLTQSPFRFIGLTMLIAALAMTTQANAQSPPSHQTIDIGGPVTGSVYGNGSGPNQTMKPSSSTTLYDNNIVNVNNGGTVTINAYGAYADSDTPTWTVNDNKVNVQSGGKVDKDVYGGYAISSGNSDPVKSYKNIVNISGNAGKDVYGGYASGGFGSVAGGNDGGNKVTIDGGTVTGNIFGGFIENTWNGDASANIVTIENGQIGGKVVGGYCVGVPVVLGNGGVQKIIEIPLNSEEEQAFKKSVEAVKGLVETMGKLIAS